MKPLLILILAVASGGLAFSGYLTYRELFASAPVAQCTPLGEPGSALGAPPCIYGFFMYLAIVVMTTLALVRRKRTA
jgi:uncharacterized membrane protein